MKTISFSEAQTAFQTLVFFLSKSQYHVLYGNCLNSEENQFFRNKMIELATIVQSMPGPYGQEGKGNDAIAYLHYFGGGCDWYITEKDSSPVQYQTFGLACIHEQELGYISIVELLAAGIVEIDLHFTPTSLKEIRKKYK